MAINRLIIGEVIPLVLCLCTSFAVPQDEVELKIHANDEIHTLVLTDLDEVSAPFKIIIRKSKLNYMDFSHIYRYDAHDRNVKIDLGRVLYGQKIDICGYFAEEEIPICQYLLVKPQPIRSPSCSSKINSIEYQFIKPEFGYYHHVTVWLQKKDGEKLSQKVSRLERSVIFTDLDADQQYRIHTVTHAGQENMPNDMQSKVLVCRTLKDND